MSSASPASASEMYRSIRFILSFLGACPVDKASAESFKANLIAFASKP